jgi:hypothetical protein
MDKSLFQIENELLAIENQLAESGGELTPELEQALEIGQQELKQKSFNYCKYIRSLEAQIDSAKTYEEQIRNYKKSKQRVIERLKMALKNAVINFDTIETEIFKISNRKSSAVEIVDEDQIPDKYKIIKQTFQIDKKAIKEAINKGEVVFGAKISENLNLQIK